MKPPPVMGAEAARIAVAERYVVGLDDVDCDDGYYFVQGKRVPDSIAAKIDAAIRENYADQDDLRTLRNVSNDLGRCYRLLKSMQMRAEKRGSVLSEPLAASVAELRNGMVSVERIVDSNA